MISLFIYLDFFIYSLIYLLIDWLTIGLLILHFYIYFPFSLFLNLIIICLLFIFSIYFIFSFFLSLCLSFSFVSLFFSLPIYFHIFTFSYCCHIFLMSSHFHTAVPTRTVWFLLVCPQQERAKWYIGLSNLVYWAQGSSLRGDSARWVLRLTKAYPV